MSVLEGAVGDSGSTAGDGDNVGRVDGAGSRTTGGDGSTVGVGQDGEVSVVSSDSLADLRVEGAGSGGSVEGSTNTGGGLLTEVDAVTEGGVDSTLGDSDGAVADGEDGTEVSGTALDQEVANESTVELGAEGRLSKSGESSHARGRGGLGSVGRRAGVLAGRGNGSRHADVLVLGNSGGHAGSEGHGGDDVADGRHFCWFEGGNN